jgi:uncharacterized membrane protein
VNNNRNYDRPTTVYTLGVLKQKFIVAIEAGTSMSLAIDKAGVLYYFGSITMLSGQGTTNVPLKVDYDSGIVFKAVSAGYQHVLALTTFGTVYSWGGNVKGEVGTGTVGTQRTLTKTVLPKSSFIVAASAGYYHSLALDSNGTIYAFGAGESGELGATVSIIDDQYFPVKVDTTGVLFDVTIKSIIAGTSYSLILDDSGKVYGFGAASMLGTGHYFANEYSPVAIYSPSEGMKVTGIATGSYLYGYCYEGYTGPECQYYFCFSTNYNDTAVCSAHGTCIAPNQCLCDIDYYGDNCQLYSCFEIQFDSANVCSSHGRCIVPNYCECSSEYRGNKCSEPVCYGQFGNDACNGPANGVCTAPNNCTCKSQYEGIYCEVEKHASIPQWAIITVGTIGGLLVVVVVFLIPTLIGCLTYRNKLRKKRKDTERIEEIMRERLLESDIELEATEDWLIRRDDLELKERLSEGSFGVVFRGLYKNAPVAIKMIKDDKTNLEEFENEVKVLRTLRHPNVVQFLGICVTDEYVFIMFLKVLTFWLGLNLL